MGNNMSIVQKIKETLDHYNAKPVKPNGYQSALLGSRNYCEYILAAWMQIKVITVSWRDNNKTIRWVGTSLCPIKLFAVSSSTL